MSIIMIQQEFIMIIMNCKKYVKKALFQKKTWLKTIPSYLKFYHVIGDENLETDYVFDNTNNILWVKTPDDYNSLPKKVIASYKAVYETYNFKYLFKTDDDQILVKPTFFNTICDLIKNINPMPHYGGYTIDITQPYLSQYNRIHPELPSHLPLYVTKYCSGRFYFLSKNAVLDLIKKREMIESEYLEDYAIGFHLNPIFKKNILKLATNLYFTDIELSDFPKLLQEGKV